MQLVVTVSSGKINPFVSLDLYNPEENRVGI